MGKKPLEFSERGCADGCGWQMGGENCADGEAKKPLEISELGCADGCGGQMRRQMGGENCADGCRRRGCKGAAGNGWGEEAPGDERAWLRGRLRTANECMGRIARTAADGVGAREWLEMGGEKKPLGMSKLGCADGCGWQMRGEKKPLEIISELECAEGCGRRGCKGGRHGWEGVAGNGWGEEAAGDERAWLTAADGMGAREWLEMGGEKKTLGRSELGCADGRLRTAWVQGSGWKWRGEKAAGDERALLRGWLRTAWVQGSGWKWVG